MAYALAVTGTPITWLPLDIFMALSFHALLDSSLPTTVRGREGERLCVGVWLGGSRQRGRGAGFISCLGDEILGRKAGVDPCGVSTGSPAPEKAGGPSMFAKRARLWRGAVSSASELSSDRARGLPEPGAIRGPAAIGRPTAGYCFFPPRAGVEALPQLSTAAAPRGQVARRGGWLAAFEEAPHVLARFSLAYRAPGYGKRYLGCHAR
jgi:hypothetical protein